jgi:hypothetical protein
MNGPPALPSLTVGDFGPGQDHVGESHQGGRVFAILHRADPARPILPLLAFSAGDLYTYVFIHGGQEVSRFEDGAVGTHEVPVPVVAELLVREFGARLDGLAVRMCTCYGNLSRPGDPGTLVQRLARLLLRTDFEAYHGLVLLDTNPPGIRLGRSVQWDPSGPYPGPVFVGPPGPWERVTP